MAAITQAESESLWNEVKGMMDDAQDDPESVQPLSSDEEGYVDRLMEGRTARIGRQSFSKFTAATPVEHRAAAAPVATGGTAFAQRMLAAFDGLRPDALSAFRPNGLDGSGRIGPAFEQQCRGHNLAEPITPSLQDVADEDEGEEEDKEDEEDESFDYAEEHEGKEQDPREWSRHTATWAEDVSDSEEEGYCRPSTDSEVSLRGARIGGGGGGGGGRGGGKGVGHGGAGAIAAFGSLRDLDDLDELDAMDEGDEAAGGSRAAGLQSADGSAATRRPELRSPRKRTGDVVRANAASGKNDGKEGASSGALGVAGMTKRVRFEEPQSAMAVDSEAAPVAVAQELRPGYTLHSEAANAAGLADLLKLIDASQLAAVASGASSAAEALELGTDRTARSKPRSKAPWRRGL